MVSLFILGLKCSSYCCYPDVLKVNLLQSFFFFFLGGGGCFKDNILLLYVTLNFSSLASGSSGLGSSPGREHCVLVLGKAINSHSASLHPGV